MSAIIFLSILAAQDLPSARDERLTNGLRIIVVEDRSRPVVSVQLWYRAGSALDAPERPGMAQLARRFLENRDQAALRVRAAGARFESRTLRDACCFETFAPAGFLDFILDVEARRMRAVRPGDVQPASVTQAATSVAQAATSVAPAATSVAQAISLCERTVEQPPWAQADSLCHTCCDGLCHTHAQAPGDLTRRAGEAWSDATPPALLAAAFPGHPYQHPPELISAELAHLPPEELRGFLGRWFVPGNAVLLIVGDVPALPTMEKVRRLFGELPWAEPPRRHEYDRGPREEVRINATGAASGVDFAWVTLPWGYFENAAVDGLMHALCNPVDGTLTLRLREAGLGDPRFERFAWYEAGLLRLSVDAPPDKLDQAERIVRETLEEAKTAVPGVAQVNRAAAAMRRRLLQRSADFRERAMLLGLHQMIGGDLLLAAHEPLRIDRVSVGDMQRAAETLADRRRIVLRRGAAAGANAEAEPLAGKIKPAPFKAPLLLDAEEALALLSEFRPPADFPLPLPASSSSEETTTTRPTAGTRAGVDVRLLPRNDVPLATVRTTVAADPAESFGAAAALLAGSSRYSAMQLADYLSYHAIEMRPFFDGRRHGLIATGPPRMAPQMAEWQAELLRRPPVDERAFEPFAAELAQARERLLRDPHRLADCLATRLASGLLADVPPPPSVGDLRAFRDRLATAGNVLVEVSGPVENDTPDAVRRIWSGVADATTHEPNGAGVAAPASETATDAETVTWHEGHGGIVEVRVVVEVGEGAELPIDVIARLLGPPNRAAAVIDGSRRWRWMAHPVRPAVIIASASLAGPVERASVPATDSAADDVVERVAALVQRVRTIESGGMPDEQLSLARRLAAVDELLGRPPALPSTAAARKGAEGSAWRIRVVAVGGEPSLRSELERAVRDRR